MTNSELFEAFRQMFVYGGFWKHEANATFKLYSYSLHFVFVLMIISFALETANSFSEGMERFAFNFGAVLSMIVTMIKVTISRTQNYQSLIADIFDKEEYLNTRTENDIRNEYSQTRGGSAIAVKCYKFTMMAAVFSSFALTIFLTIQHEKSICPQDVCEKPLLLPVWIPIDPMKHYILANILFNLITIVVGLVTVSVDFVVLCPLIYLIFRLRILKYVLRNTEKFLDRRNRETERKHFELTLECILEHENIIEEFHRFNSMMKYILFFDFLLHSTQIAAFAVSLISKTLISVENTLNLACLNYVFIQLFIIYWHGQVLIDESATIPTAIYESNWYETDLKSRRFLLMMMIRSRKPLGLKIGLVGTVDLNLFRQIVKTIYSIMTVFTNT